MTTYLPPLCSYEHLFSFNSIMNFVIPSKWLEVIGHWKIPFLLFTVTLSYMSYA